MEMRRIVLLLASMVLAVIFVSGVALADSPTTKEDCKKGGYAKYGFKNQAQCIKAVKAPPDTTAPETTITAGPEQNSQSEMEAATFEFTSSEPNSTFECQALSHTFGSAVKGEILNLWHPCTSPMTYSPLRDDTITFRVRAIDGAGNVDLTPAERLFYARREGPSIQITSGPEDRSTVNTDSVTFEWTTDGVTPFDSRCSLRDPDGVWIVYFSPCSSPKTYQLTEDGAYHFGVFVEDATGNHNGLGTSFLVDNYPPDTTITRNDSPDPVSNLYDVEYTLDSTELPLDVQCRVYLQDEVPGDWVNRCDPAVSPGAITTSRVDGTYIFEARATDQAGTVDPTPASDTIVLKKPDTSN
jgi:large repetitive protein